MKDEGYRTEDRGHDGERWECEDGSELVHMRSKFEEDEGIEFVYFEDCVTTVLSEAV